MTGLAFSVQPGVKVPPSLVNIYKEVKANYPEFEIPKHGWGLLLIHHHLCPNLMLVGRYLGSWASQGVLCLNTCLTVKAHKANSHAKKGWEQFTQTVIDLVDKHGGEGLSDNKDKGVVFLAWGKPAEQRVAKVDSNKHLILKSAVGSYRLVHMKVHLTRTPLICPASIAPQCGQRFPWQPTLYQGQRMVEKAARRGLHDGLDKARASTGDARHQLISLLSLFPKSNCSARSLALHSVYLSTLL